MKHLMKFIKIVQLQFYKFTNKNYMLLIGSDKFLQSHNFDRTRLSYHLSRFTDVCTVRYNCMRSTMYSTSWVFDHMHRGTRKVFFSVIGSVIPQTYSSILHGVNGNTRWDKIRLTQEVRTRVKAVELELLSLLASASSRKVEITAVLIGPEYSRSPMLIYGWENEIREAMRSRKAPDKRIDDLMDQLMDVIHDELMKVVEKQSFVEMVDLRKVGTHVSGIVNYDQMAVRIFSA